MTIVIFEYMAIVMYSVKRNQEAAVRVSREQAEENRQRVLEVAARAYRERGFAGIGVADIMKAAGLTHGGFYGQFASKDALVAKAVEKALEDGVAAFRKIAAKGARDPLAAIARAYLAKAHRDAPGAGCAVAALAPEVARSAPEVRRAMTAGVRAFLDLLTEGAPGATERERREAAILTYTRLVGALVVARAVDDEPLSDELLDVVARATTAPHPK